MGRHEDQVGQAERLILLSAGTAARRQAARAQATQLAATLDFSQLARMLGAWRLLPTLGPRLIELAGERCPETFAAAVQGAIDAGRRQAALLQAIAAKTTDALAGAGIRATTLKGPALSEELYGDAGRRPSGDIDLLVAREQLRQAVDVVRGFGYAVPAHELQGHDPPLLHFTLVHEREQLPPVELHWRIHWYESQWARERLLAPAGAGSAWRPAPGDRLIALLLYYARDGFLSMRYAADIGAWWDAYGGELQRGALEASIRPYPALQPVLAAALRVAEKTVGLPLAQIEPSGARLGRRGRLAVRLAEPYPHSSEAQLYADIGLIDGLLTPPGGFREFVKRQVALSREPDAGAPQRIPAWSDSGLAQGLRMLVRYGLAMSRLLRPRNSPHATLV